MSFLAQCLITLLLRKPDFARARPSTLLTDNKTYDQLYAENGNLLVYYNVGRLGKKVQGNLRKTQDWSSSEKNDVLFYVLYGVVIKLLGKTEIKPVDIANIDLNTVTEEFIDSIKWQVYNKYNELGGDGRVAKSSGFITNIDNLILGKE